MHNKILHENCSSSRRYPYQWLMGAYARVGDVKKVYQLRRLQRMHSLDKGMDDKAYNYCVLSHLKAGYVCLSFKDIRNFFKTFEILKFCIRSCRDINGANTALAELRKEGCCMHRCVQHALLEFHAKSGNMLEINQVLDRCKDEQTEDHGKAILFVINELARNGLSSNIDSLLLLLPSIYQLDEAIRSAIPQFVEQNRSLLMVKILMESGVDLRIHIKHLFKEMVYHEVSSDEFDSVWDKLNSIGFSIDSHFQFYEPALHSKSIKLIEAILNHMHLEQMSIDKETVKTWIKLSREKGPQYFLSTAQLIIAVYKVDPESKLGQDMVFSGYNWSTDPIGLLAHMLHFHIGSRDIVFALIEAILNENNIETAIQIIEKYVYDYDNDNIKTLLLEAYFQTRDVPNFVRFINLVRKYRLMKSWKKVDAIQIMQMRYDLTDELVQQIVVDERMDIELLSTTLQTMRNNGLFISRQCFNKIAAVIGRSGESSRILSLLEAMSTKNPI